MLKRSQKFGKQQFEAVTAATTSLSKGLQEIATETTDYSKKALAANTSVVEKLLGRQERRNRRPNSDGIRQERL